MDQDPTRVVRWSLLMSLGAVAAAIAVVLLTDSLVWAVVALFGFGILVNAIIRPENRAPRCRRRR